MVFIPRWEKYKDKKPSGLVEVNYANELANGIAFALVANEETPRDLLNQTTLTKSGAVTFDPEKGFYFPGTSVNDYIELDDQNRYAANQDFSLFVLSELTTATIAYPTIIARGDTGANEWMLRDSSISGDQNLNFYADVGGFNTSISTTVKTGRQESYAASIRPQGVVWAEVYFNGNYYGHDSTGGWAGTVAKNITIGQADFATNRSFAGYINTVYIYNTFLSAEAQLALSENPYQILKPRQKFFVFGASAGTQTLTPSLVTNTNTFETATVTTQNTLSASVVTNTSSFHSATVSAGNNLQPSVVTNSQTFHDVTLTTSNSIVVNLYANSASFHSATVAASNSLQASLVTNTQSFYSADVTPSNSLQASLLTNTQTFYSPVVSLEGSQVVAPNLLTNTQSFYSASVSTGSVSVAASLVTNSQTFYTANVSQGAVVIQPDVLVNSSAFYNATVSPGTVALQPSLLTSSNSFYTAVVSLEGSQPLAPSVVINSSTFHNATVTTGTVTLTADHWSNANSFYAATVTPVNTLQPALVTNAPSFYTHVVTAGAPTLQPSLLTNSSVFYTANVTLGAGTQTLQPSLVVNNNVFYNGQVVFDQTLDAGLFVNQPTFYTHALIDQSLYKEVIEFNLSLKTDDLKSVQVVQFYDFNIGL